jgi:aspartate/methionine/tyrosine aminotransferase
MGNRDITSSYSLAKDIIDKRNVAAVPGSDFGIPHTLRLSYSTSRWQEGIDRLAGYFSES